ncbi:hypothetical protein VJI94_08265, partial [Parvimonas sp. D9]
MMFSVFCKDTNSSNVSRIFLVFTLVAESLGLAITNRGGKLSLGPPLGGIIFAQELAMIMITKQSAIPYKRIMSVKRFFMRGANLQAF